jgi:catechol 2,3-dioxygenase-like lactoylglutathione lyase family enzyme
MLGGVDGDCETRPVLGHLGLNVTDLVAAKAYYDELMPLVDFEPFVVAPDQFAYRPAGGRPGTYLFFYPASEQVPFSRERPGLQHLAFMVPTRAVVDRVHEHVVSRGGEVLHEPQTFPQYPPPYYATFWLDPDGLMLEAVCHHDRD